MAKSCFYQVCRLLLSKSCCLPFITVLCLLSLLLSSLQMESSLKLDLRTRFDKISPWASFHIEKSSNVERSLQEKEIDSSPDEPQKHADKYYGPAVDYFRAPPSNILKDRAKDVIMVKKRREKDQVKKTINQDKSEVTSIGQTDGVKAIEVLPSHKDDDSFRVANVSNKIEALKLKLNENLSGKKKWSPKEIKESPKEIKVKTNLDPAALKESINRELGKLTSILCYYFCLFQKERKRKPPCRR